MQENARTSFLCMCTFDRCKHEEAKRCGNSPTTVKLTAETQNGLQISVPVCDECWDNIRKVFPVNWPPPKAKSGGGGGGGFLVKGT